MGKKVDDQTKRTEADRLKSLFDLENITNFALFARDHEIPGGKSMINQHKEAVRPISLEAGIAYAKAFGCSLDQISKRLAEIADRSSALSPSSNTQNQSQSAQSSHDNDKDSAMLLSFPKMTPDKISAPDGYIISQYRAGGSMGHGLTLPDQPGIIQNWSVSRDWLNKNVKSHTGVGNLAIVTGFGPSMQPMYNPGDPLLVDTGVTSVIADGVYFFRVGKEGFIKQLQKIPTQLGIKYIAKSKNPDYDNFEITEGMDFEILGRVVRVWCGTDF